MKSTSNFPSVTKFLDRRTTKLQLSRHITYFLITVIFANAGWSSETKGPDNCSSLLESKAQNFVQHYRKRHLSELDSASDFSVEGYQLNGLLGRSTSEAYLATDMRTHQAVVIKRSIRTAPLVLAMLWRELAVTEYLLDIGERIPRILSVKVNNNGSAILIREYFVGLTGSELEKERRQSSSLIPTELSTNAWEQLEPERVRLSHLFFEGNGKHPTFRNWYALHQDWLSKKYSDAHESIERLTQRDYEIKSKINDYLYTQDFGTANFLYELDKKRWVPFDP